MHAASVWQNHECSITSSIFLGVHDQGFPAAVNSRLLLQVVLVNHDNDPELLALDEAAVEAIANSIANYRGEGQRIGIQVCKYCICLHIFR